MHIYGLKCSDCEHVFEVMCKYSEKTDQKCPSCGSANYESHHSTPPPIGDPVRLGVRTIDNGFREVLSRIGSSNGRKANLRDKLSRR